MSVDVVAATPSVATSPPGLSQGFRPRSLRAWRSASSLSAAPKGPFTRPTRNPLTGLRHAAAIGEEEAARRPGPPAIREGRLTLAARAVGPKRGPPPTPSDGVVAAPKRRVADISTGRAPGAFTQLKRARVIGPNGPVSLDPRNIMATGARPNGAPVRLLKSERMEANEANKEDGRHGPSDAATRTPLARKAAPLPAISTPQEVSASEVGRETTPEPFATSALHPCPTPSTPRASREEVSEVGREPITAPAALPYIAARPGNAPSRGPPISAPRVRSPRPRPSLRRDR